MLTECPKCGFQQPEDEYCAQCGVNMLQFKPTRPPLLKRFFSNPAAQIALVLLVMLITASQLLIKHRDNKNLKSIYNKGIQVSQTKDIKSGFQSLSDANKIQNESINQAQALSSEDKDSLKVKDLDNSTLIIYFAEIPNSILQKQWEASQTTGMFSSFRDYTAGILPNAKKLITDSKATILLKEEKKFELGQPINLFYGIKDNNHSDLEVGFDIYIEISKFDGSVLVGNFEVHRSWKSDQVTESGIQKSSYPAIFEINSESGFFMSGVMPNRIDRNLASELSSFPIYKILGSKSFQQGQSSFVIYILYK